MLLAFVLFFSLLGLLAFGVKGVAVEGALTWAALVTVYAAFWFALALVVNLWGKGSASNAMTLLGCWLALVLLVPSVVGVVASTLYPVPSRLELIQANRDAAAKAAAQSSAVLARYYEDHPDLLPKSQRVSEPDAYLRYFATQEIVAGRVEPLMAQYDVQLEKQQDLVNRLRFFSPAILAQEAMNDLAGTGFLRYRRFTAQANQFHDEYRSYFRDKAFARVKMASTDYDDIPGFRWSEEPSGQTAQRQLVAIGALAVATLVLLVGAWSLTRRKDLVAG